MSNVSVTISEDLNRKSQPLQPKAAKRLMIVLLLRCVITLTITKTFIKPICVRLTVWSALSFYLLANKLSSAIFILPPGLQDSCRVSLIKEKCHVPQNLPDRRFRLYLSRFLRFAAVDRAGWYARKCGLWLYQYVFKADLKIPCEYCLVLFDAKRQNFRNDIFPTTKARVKKFPKI